MESERDNRGVTDEEKVLTHLSLHAPLEGAVARTKSVHGGGGGGLGQVDAA